MVSDTEPRYRLVDSNGNVVGSLYAEADGTLKLQEGTSGSDNEVSVATDGTVSAPALSTDSLIIRSKVTDRNYTEVYNQNFGNETIDETVTSAGGYDYVIKVENFQEDVASDLRLQIEGFTASAYRNIVQDGTGSITASTYSYLKLCQGVASGVWTGLGVDGDNDYAGLVGGGIGDDVVSSNSWLTSGVLRRNAELGDLRFFTSGDIASCRIRVFRVI